MSDVSQPPQGRLADPVLQNPVADGRQDADRTMREPAPADGLSSSHGSLDASGVVGAARDTRSTGSAPATVTADREAADLADLSHSMGDGARYAVEIAHARAGAHAHVDTGPRLAAKLRLRRALLNVRWVCTQAMRQRMHTEMADLASQVRKMHDRDSAQR